MTPRLIDYHLARARGGVALTIMEIASVHETSPGPLDATTDEVCDGLSELTTATHAEGMQVFQQLWHAGAEARPRTGPTWAPSAVPGLSTGVVPLAMTLDMIAEVVAGFAAAARRCVEAGIDGLEVHAAHGYLPGQFLSPATNHRTDAYGGHLEGRLRFLEEVLGAVRAAVPSSVPVGVRLSADDGLDRGLRPPEVADIAAMLEDRGLIDFLDVSMGSYHAYDKIVGAMHEPRGYELDSTRPVTAAVDVPTIVAGRLVDLDDAERVIAEGTADMVAMVRATIADARIVAKSLAGDGDAVRPCISCNQACIGGVRGPSRRLGCTVNPDVGGAHDGRDTGQATTPRSVGVIGGGPAGLEAALTAASRGHEVVLYEAEDELGGLVRLARRAPHRQDLGAIVDWLAVRARGEGVDVRLGHRVTDVADLDHDHDVVLVATGAAPMLTGPLRNRPGVAVRRADGARVCAPESVLGGSVDVPERVVLFDDAGSHVAASTAEFLLARGAAVTYATSLDMVAPSLEPSLQREPLLARLAATGRCTTVSRVALVEVRADAVVLQGLDGGEQREVAAGLLVLEAGRQSRRGILSALQDGDHRLIGDALVPRGLPHAISSGRAAAIAL